MIVMTATLFVVDSGVASADWLTMPGPYSHDPVSGRRIAQYAPVAAPAAPQVANFRSSGYTHTRSTLAYGQSADNYHRVEEWGDPVRPYGEWRFPYRPFSTPYPNWGPPYAGLGGIGFGGIGFGGGGFGGQYPPGIPNQPGLPFPGQPFPGQPGVPGAGYPVRPGFPNPAAGTDGFAPYPSGIGTPYPVAPYYDGYYPNYRD